MKPTSGMNPITEDDIANFLANTPDFFERHAQLLASVQQRPSHSRRRPKSRPVSDPRFPVRQR